MSEYVILIGFAIFWAWGFYWGRRTDMFSKYIPRK
jgi:hypothetical protein